MGCVVPLPLKTACGEFSASLTNLIFTGDLSRGLRRESDLEMGALAGRHGKRETQCPRSRIRAPPQSADRHGNTGIAGGQSCRSRCLLRAHGHFAKVQRRRGYGEIARCYRMAVDWLPESACACWSSRLRNPAE